MELKRSHCVALAFFVGAGLTLYNPMGAVGVAMFAGPIWLWFDIIDPWMKRRRKAKLAAERAAE
jgi:hypothetical protein